MRESRSEARVLDRQAGVLGTDSTWARVCLNCVSGASASVIPSAAVEGHAVADATVTRNDGGARLSVVEKVGYGLGDTAANFIFQTMVMFQLAFYTDTFGITKLLLREPCWW